MQLAPDAAEVPDNLGKFRIDSVLGQGGSGVVYGARLGERRVALKVLRPDQVPTGRERRRFIEEALHMQRIDHPCIVRVIDAGELDDGRPYLAMERLEGENLGQRLQRGPIARDVALAIFDQLAAAVGAMHDAGLIHRDLKPENVMLVGDDRAVLLDFGIAKPADAPPSTTTQVGMQRGTPAYMAPERFFGARASLASDIYELGVILYVMLVGGMPWADPMNAKARLEPVPPHSYDEGFPPPLEAALMAALSADAHDRPASALALSRSIRDASWKGETVPIRAGATPPDAESTEDMRRKSPVARNLLFVAIPLLGVAAAIAITLWATSGGDDSDGKGDRVAAITPSAPRDVKNKAPAPAPHAAPAPTADAGVALAPVSDTDTPVDDTPPPATPEPEPRDHRPRAKAPPEESPDESPPKDSAQESSSATSGQLPSCRKVAALYCAPEFEATEGTMSGALCTSMTKNVKTWEAMPPAARAEQDKWCTDNYAKLAAAVTERLRLYEKLDSSGAP